MGGVVKLAAIGDIALSHGYNELLVSYGPDYPFAKVRSFFKEHDIILANLEAPFCKSGETYPLKCSLRADPKYITGLKTAGINLVSLANNHILDYRELAFSKTRELLDQYNIKHFGAGNNLREAREPVVYNVKGVSSGFLGYCDVQIDSPFYASEQKRGISPLKMEYLKNDIAKLSQKVDIVIVSLHWGVENWSYPTPQQRKQAHQIIEYGADIIIGHHPHVIQGIEQYQGGYIIYSLGNFLFSDINWSWVNENSKTINSKVILENKNRESLILSMTFDSKGIREIEYRPCVIDADSQVNLLDYDHKIMKRLNNLSQKMMIDDYEKFWRRYQTMKRRKIALKNGFNWLKKIHRLCPKHFKKLTNNLSR